jgi:hypothetical protein
VHIGGKECAKNYTLFSALYCLLPQQAGERAAAGSNLFPAAHTFVPMQRAHQATNQHSFLVASFPRSGSKLFERANFNQQSDESKSSTTNISQCGRGGRRKRKCISAFFVPTGSGDGDAAAKRHRGRERETRSGMKNHVAKFTLLVGCVKNGLFAHA